MTNIFRVLLGAYLLLELWSLTVEKLEEKVSTIDNLTLSLKFVHLFVCLLEGKGIHRTQVCNTARAPNFNCGVSNQSQKGPYKVR